MNVDKITALMKNCCEHYAKTKSGLVQHVYLNIIWKINSDKKKTIGDSPVDTLIIIIPY